MERSMSPEHNPRVWLTLLLVIFSPAVSNCGRENADRSESVTKVPEFGLYEGYSEQQYDGWLNTSRYVEMRDGVRLAVDVTFPAEDGEIADGPFPVVWTHTRYHRNRGALLRYSTPEGEEPPQVESLVDDSEHLQLLVKRGYIVAAAQVRGGGASFCTFQGLLSEAETKDAYELIDWFADQPWCDGNVGMWGGSYDGMTQYMAASKAHPALKAIFPRRSGVDMYDLVHPGGVFRKDLLGHWGELTRNLDVHWPGPPVEGDEDGVLLRAALAEHEHNWDAVKEYTAGRFRDHDTPSLTWTNHGVPGVLEDLLEAAVPAYHWNGWLDVFSRDSFVLYQNYSGPQKLAMGAWGHSRMPDSLLTAERMRIVAVEQLRWFDYWLKGIDNGIMDEPPIHYAVIEDPADWVWSSLREWPPAGSESTTFFFLQGPSGTVESVNDGSLSEDRPTMPGAHRYRVDLTTTTGTQTRWDNATNGSRYLVYPDLSDTDGKSLTYTSSPLDEDLRAVGHPVVTLWVTSSTLDGDFIVLLEEVDETGTSQYVTEGTLRASYRKEGAAAWDNLGLPFHRGFAEDLSPLPRGESEQLTLDLLPIATVFNAGNRIRVTVMGADADNVEPPTDPPEYEVYWGASFPSHLTLPVLR
jgi:putative CocE/NonD family hydrolase